MKTALIIPAYKPDEKMLALLEQFRLSDSFVPVVVDDGSGDDYLAIFDAVPDFAVLLRHEVNKGKGAALKTAMRHVLDKMPECDSCVTADADGQHRYEDILKVHNTLMQHPDALIIGGREFTGKVPFRSKFGNAVTRCVFRLASGVKIHDTQTGLRAYGREAMKKFTEIGGDRYEYEINVLLEAARTRMEMIEVKIATVYLNDNESSSFNPIKDSIKIYKCIFRYVFRRGKKGAQ